MRRARVLIALVLVVTLVACSGGGDGAGERTTSSEPSSTTSTTVAPSTTTTEPPSIWPDLPRIDEPRARRTPTGVVVPVGADGIALTPCARSADVRGEAIFGAHVVLDAGHGGEEPGAVGPNGLLEKDVNLAVAQETARILRKTGATVVLTRTGDYRISIQTRAAIATRLEPLAFVSIHHNAAPDEYRPTPGAETYFQIASPESKRLAGLVYEEVFAALEDAGGSIEWAADRDAGAKYRPSSDGGDYYGILRRSAGVPTVLSEAAFISNAPEEALLATVAFRRAEAQALADAVVRFVSSDAPGSGFVTPYPRTEPAGPGGGTSGCEDPPLA